MFALGNLQEQLLDGISMPAENYSVLFCWYQKSWYLIFLWPSNFIMPSSYLYLNFYCFKIVGVSYKVTSSRKTESLAQEPSGQNGLRLKFCLGEKRWRRWIIFGRWTNLLLYLGDFNLKQRGGVEICWIINQGLVLTVFTNIWKLLSDVAKDICETCLCCMQKQVIKGQDYNIVAAGP